MQSLGVRRGLIFRVTVIITVIHVDRKMLISDFKTMRLTEIESSLSVLENKHVPTLCMWETLLDCLFFLKLVKKATKDYCGKKLFFISDK